MLSIYVDYTIVIGDDTEEIDKLQGTLNFEFETKDLGALKYFLRVEVARSNGRFYLSQHKYVLDFLSKMGSLDVHLHNSHHPKPSSRYTS